MSMENILHALIKSGVPGLMWGAPGVAKTATVTEMAEAMNLHLEVMIGSVREPADIGGYPSAGTATLYKKDNEGNHIWVPKTDHKGQPVLDEKGDTVMERVIDRVVPITEYTVPPALFRLNNALEMGYDGGLLFLDELTTCGPAVQAALLRGVNERVFGDEPLADHVSILGAANPPEMAPNGASLAPASANRWCHLEWTPNVEGWLQGIANGFTLNPFAAGRNPDGSSLGSGTASAGRKAEIRGIVAGYIQHRNNALLQYPKATDETGRGWPSPRSWHNLVKVWPHLSSDNDQRVVAVGLVGRSAADEFLTYFHNIKEDLPTTEEVLKKGVDWKRSWRPDQLFAVMSSLTSYAISESSHSENGDEVVDRTWEIINEAAEHGKVGIAYSAMTRMWTADFSIPREYVESLLAARKEATRMT